MQQALTLNDIKGACEKCLEGSPDVQGLVQHGCNMDAIGRVAAASTSGSILALTTSVLSKLEQEQQPAESNPTKIAIAAMIQTLRVYAQNESFVARFVVDQGMEYFALLIDPSADPQKLQDLFARFDEYRDQKENPGELSAIGSFIFDGVIGKGLVEYVRDLLAKQLHDVEAAELVSEVEASGRVISGSDWDPFVAGAVDALEQQLVPFKNKLEGLAFGRNPVFSVSQRKKKRSSG